MNTIEERLWNYIDGACSDEERKAIDRLIEQDEAYRSKFEELLSFDKQLAKMEMDEPSMGFTYKVMENIRAEHAQQPLRARINPRIIKGIAGFFIVTILLLVVYMFWSAPMAPVNFSKHLTISLKMPEGFKLPEIKNYLGKPLLQGFFFVDVVLGLFLADTYLRKKRLSKQV